MRAHILSGNVISNTIIIDELEPGMLDASIGGAIGDEYDAETGTFKPSEGKIAATANSQRILRNALLAETDKWVAIAAEKGEALSPEKAAYRQALRDLPEAEGWPFKITWPINPDLIDEVVEQPTEPE